MRRNTPDRRLVPPFQIKELPCDCVAREYISSTLKGVSNSICYLLSVLPRSKSGAHFGEAADSLHRYLVSLTRTKTAAVSSPYLDARHSKPACSKRESTKTTSSRSRCTGKWRIPRRRHRVGRDIVWEEDERTANGDGWKQRDLACGLWKTTWINAREVGSPR